MSAPWMPSGRHEVDVGPSLKRTLKARKGEAVPGRKHDRDFYSFRYNFKPESIDPTQPGSIAISRTKELASATVQRASTQSGEGHLFKGTENPTKEWDCVLIYDEETGHYTLEKVESFVSLNYERKTKNGGRFTPSPEPDTPSYDFGAQLQQELGILEQDLDGEGSLEEGEEESKPLPLLPPPPPPAARKSAVPRPGKRVAPKVEEEELQFGQGSSSMKRSRSASPLDYLALPVKQFKSKSPSPMLPPPAPPARSMSPGLSLPGAILKKPRSPSPEGLSLPGAAPPLHSLPPSPSSPLYSAAPGSDDSGEWDEVAVAQPGVIVIDGSEDVEDIDDNFLDMELNEELGEAEGEPESEEDDFLAEAVSPVPEPDDYSSSDSDE